MIIKKPISQITIKNVIKHNAKQMPVILSMPLWLFWAHVKTQLNEAFRKANLSYGQLLKC